MYMKKHILAALSEEFEQWEGVLARLDHRQIAAVHPDDHRSIKDDLAHLWAWQQRTIARVEAAVFDRQPVFPSWPDEIDLTAGDAINLANDWIFETYREKPWLEVYQNWRAGFLRLQDLAEQVAERDMLDGERYPWLNENSLAVFLLGTYDHHQEHVQKARNIAEM